MNSPFQLSGIFCYPIKSLSGISLSSASLSDRGLTHDRRWMLISPEGMFLTQRRFPQMTQLEVALTEEGLKVSHKQSHADPLLIPFEPVSEESLEVQIWDHSCEAQVVHPEADAWFSKVLAITCRLVFMPDHSHRKVNPQRVDQGEIVSFADGYPHLLIGQASLDLLNQKMPKPLPMDRFRPNLVFSGGQAHEEDNWDRFRIGETSFRAVKACVRCTLTTIDQESGVKGAEPLKTLATYRKRGNEVIFGQNLVHAGKGRISVGDEIEVLSRKGPGMPI